MKNKSETKMQLSWRIQHWYYQAKENLEWKIARALPKKIKYLVVIDAWVEATPSDKHPDDTSVHDVLDTLDPFKAGNTRI